MRSVITPGSHTFVTPATPADMPALAGWHVRPAQLADLPGLVALAEAADPGMTNLPADRGALAARIERSLDAFARPLAAPEDELYLLVLDDGTGRAVGTACLFSRIGQTWPFYSYKRTQIVHHSPTLARHDSHELLQITNDFGGASEVGGLFLHPAVRSSGAGRLLARSRYLFIAMHRARFAATTIAELRGWVSPDGGTPFWDAVGRQFFGMSLWEADRYCALHGNQLIADLMPRYPVYVALLPETARAAIGRVHASSQPALRLLEHEGLRLTGHVDIFDAGPSVACPTDQLRTLVDGRTARVARAAAPDAQLPHLIACGELGTFRCWLDRVGPAEPGDDRLRLSGAADCGEAVFHVPF
ncbi:arginine N-succinyltransferase [Novosphingobium piscinae]|uniref:Arginine N-succinyltransferase n=1 Tax=Novosphingobium piscinae TaxID=1507448 RepID=A0A7X1KNP0_9SPHN|nr:arginine N-succinyltransferase [Novosphingobium piscinae]MBC2667904.1 arginine N-succinyltransferase [Novosphingobium piscinae]